MSQKRMALLLINLGTPDEPTRPAVKRYLTQFLNDKYVIDIPWLFRKILVNGIIIPFRVKRSTALYQQVWTPQGSPLTLYTESLKHKLQAKLNPDTTVFTAMRYQNPPIASTLAKIKAENFDKLVVLPLYPHFADSTTTSTLEEVKRVIKHWDEKPEIQFIEEFHDHPAYLTAFANKINSYKPERFDHIVFSYHGLPNGHIEKIHRQYALPDCDPENDTAEHCKVCYRAACYHTTKLLAEQLNLPESSYTTTFQSRLSKNWLEPFSDKTLIDLAHMGCKRVLVVAPAFVADCLETIIELGVEYKDLFIENGGQELTWVESLNADDAWVEGIRKIVSL